MGLCVCVCPVYFDEFGLAMEYRDYRLSFSCLYLSFFHSISHVYLHLQIEEKKKNIQHFLSVFARAFLSLFAANSTQSVFTDKAAQTVTFRIELVFLIHLFVYWSDQTKPSQVNFSALNIKKFWWKLANDSSRNSEIKSERGRKAGKKMK